MQTVADPVGAGDLGGALARTLASSDAVSRIVLIDDARTVAAGKALDIRQTGPIQLDDTAVEGTDDLHQSSGADVVVLRRPARTTRVERRGRIGAGRPRGQDDGRRRWSLPAPVTMS